MCGGVGFKIKDIKKSELEKYYSQAEVGRIRNEGRAESFFWHKQAVLPVKEKDGVHLLLWGNKNTGIRLPKTGWAKAESLASGRWDYLHPQPVDIAVESGYEKKVWFDLPSGTKGIIVERDGEERVYMVTQPASDSYKRETGHDREPPGKKIHFRH
jgi:hypothetical protein